MIADTPPELETGESPNAPSWKDTDAFAVIAIGLFLASGGLAARLTGADVSSPIPLGYSHLLAMMLPFIFAGTLLMRRAMESRQSFRQILGIRDPLREIVRGLCGGVLTVPPAMAIAYATGKVITALSGMPPERQPVMESILMPSTPLPVAVIALILCITLTPLAEEIMYRGVLVSVLRLRHNTGYAVLLSSVFFSLLHLNLTLLPSLGFVGAAFALAYLKSRSLLTSMAMHAAFNGTNLLLATWP